MSEAMDLSQLQNLIKRDAEGYLDEFMLRKRHFESQLEVFRLSPSTGASKAFADLVTFMAQVSFCYPKQMGDFPARLAQLLEQHASEMPASLRRSMVSSLILMRNRNQVTPTALLSLFFSLFRVRDKVMRKQLHAHIVSDVRGLNARGRNNRVNTAMQNYMYTMLSDPSSIAAKKSLDVLMELYRRGVWTDARTVNVIASACLSDEPRLIVACLKFFLGVDEDGVGDEDEGDDEVDPQTLKELQDSVKQKLTKKKKKHAQKVLEKAMKGKTKKKTGAAQRDFAALHLIHDPQTFAEKLFARVKRSSGGFETRVMALTLISRLIGIHRLILLNFYPYLLRYVQPHSPSVTVLMAVLAQATHDLVPPDALEPVIAHIVDSFVSDKSSDLAVALGINTIRELCSRAPLCMDKDTLSDLVGHKTSRSRPVSAAAKSLIALYREMDPGMLDKKERGKEGALRLVEGGLKNKAVVDSSTVGMESGVRTARYGEQVASREVEGMDLLREYEAEHGGPAGDDGWEDVDADEESSSGWIDVSDDEGVLNLPGDDSDSDSDSDEKSDAKRAKAAAKIESSKASDDKDRILTPADFERLKVLKAKKRLETALGAARTKRQREMIEAHANEITEQPSASNEGLSNARDAGERVDPDALEGPRKKAKMDHQQRAEHAKSGREDRGTFGSKLGNRAKDGGTSNTEKLRSKPFVLVRHAKRVEQKKNMSFRDKQKQAQKHKSNQWRAKNKSGK